MKKVLTTISCVGIIVNGSVTSRDAATCLSSTGVRGGSNWKVCEGNIFAQSSTSCKIWFSLGDISLRELPAGSGALLHLPINVCRDNGSIGGAKSTVDGKTIVTTVSGDVITCKFGQSEVIGYIHLYSQSGAVAPGNEWKLCTALFHHKTGVIEALNSGLSTIEFEYTQTHPSPVCKKIVVHPDSIQINGISATGGVLNLQRTAFQTGTLQNSARSFVQRKICGKASIASPTLVSSVRNSFNIDQRDDQLDLGFVRAIFLSPTGFFQPRSASMPEITLSTITCKHREESVFGSIEDLQVDPSSTPLEVCKSLWLLRKKIVEPERS
jgi:hypothetical protein